MSNILDKLPERLHAVLSAIHQDGGIPYLVGGCVRDHLLDLPIKDFDVEVYRMSVDALAATLARFGQVDMVGRAFGVLKLHGVDADFSLPRRDSKVGVGHRGINAQVDPGMTPIEACRRRDLTINAMMADTMFGHIVDHFGGMDDLRRHKMRAVDPSTFLEDPLRALRVARFASQLICTPDAELQRLCGQANLAELPGERLYAEFHKMLVVAQFPELGLLLMRLSDMLRSFPELHAMHGTLQDPAHHAEGDVYTHTTMVCREVRRAAGSGDERRAMALMFGALCHDMGKPAVTTYVDGRWRAHGHDDAGVEPATRFLARLRAPTRLIADVSVLTREHLCPFFILRDNPGPRAYRRLAARMGDVPVEWLAELARADARGRISDEPRHVNADDDIDRFLERARDVHVDLQRPDDVVMGRHLIARGMTPGPDFGRILAQCRELQLDTGLTDPEVILQSVLGKGDVR